MGPQNATKAAPRATGNDLRIDEHGPALVNSHSKNQPNQQDIPVATVQKNSREVYRVAIRYFKGRRLVDLRVFASNGLEQTATPKGVAIKPERLRPIIEALERAETLAKSEGLI